MLTAAVTGFSDIFQYIRDGGFVGLLTFILLGGYRKWWVFGWLYSDAEQRTVKAEKERDDWRDLALHGTNLVEQTVDLFKRSRGT